MARVIVIPGLAVHAYAEEPTRHLQECGHDASLLPAPTWRGAEVDLAAYGRRAAAEIDRDGRPVDVLVGLSVGTQAAAVAAASTSLVRHLVLVSPTIEPTRRSMPRQFAAWATPNPHEEPGLFFKQLPDWWRSGVPRILRGFGSALHLPLEEVLPEVTAAVTIIHAEYDPITSHGYAARLAEQTGARLQLVSGRTHSWPKRDGPGLAALVEELTA